MNRRSQRSCYGTEDSLVLTSIRHVMLCDMDQPEVSSDSSAAATEVSPAVLRRFFVISLLPVIGVLLFAVAGVLGLLAFAHNTSLACEGFFAGPMDTDCSHSSYWLPVSLGVSALLLVLGGGAFSSYYAARHIGLPVLAAFQQRRRVTR